MKTTQLLYNGHKIMIIVKDDMPILSIKSLN